MTRTASSEAGPMRSAISLFLFALDEIYCVSSLALHIIKFDGHLPWSIFTILLNLYLPSFTYYIVKRNVICCL